MKYAIAVYGNVSISTEYFSEGEIRAISDEVAASQEVIDFVASKHLAVFNTLELAKAHTFAPLHTLLQNETHLNKKTWANAPTVVIAALAADQAVEVALANVKRQTLNLAEVLADKNAATGGAIANATIVYDVFVAKKAAADLALTNAYAAQAAAITALK